MAVLPELHELQTPEAVTLRNGLQVEIRRIRPDDWPELISLVKRLSPRSRRLRFFTPKGRISDQFAQRLATVDFDLRAAFVVTLPGESAIRAVGRYERTPGTSDAEVAFVVEDAYHGLGIATHLLVHLRLLATTRGIATFSATVLGENSDMLAVFRFSGLGPRFHYDRDLVRVEMDLVFPAL